MMKRFFWWWMCVFFPWVVLLIEDNPGGAVVALVMQATVIGWIPAMMWAFHTRKEKLAPKKPKAAK